jgi:hypothetical protein
MDGADLMGRKIKVNDVKSTGKTRAPAETYGRDPRGEDRYDDRRSSHHSSERKPPPKRGFRVSVTGLPDDYTWAQLKDLLRSGASGTNAITYANVSRPGFGYSFGTCLYLLLVHVLA